MRSSLNSDNFFFFTHLKPFTAFETLPIHTNYLIRNILYMMIHCFIIIFLIFIICFSIPMSCLTNITPNLFFNHLLIILILLPSFLNKLAMLIRVQAQNIQDQAHIYPDTYFLSFQIHLQAIMYHFKHSNYGIYRDFFFQIHPIFFGCAHNPHR